MVDKNHAFFKSKNRIFSFRSKFFYFYDFFDLISADVGDVILLSQP